MAINHYFEVFSNDGSTTLFTTANTVNGDTIITVTETGLIIGTETYTYSGTKKFVGVSFSENSTSPELAIGESFDGNTAYVYIVEAEPTTSGVTVKYNGSVVATIPSGNKATIPIANKKMKTDIVITVPEAEGDIPEYSEVEGFEVFTSAADEGSLELGYITPQDVKLSAPADGVSPERFVNLYDDNFAPWNIKSGVSIFGMTGNYEGSPLPTEVSTEAEMTALLESGEIGGVYKYIGETTEAYENGALYVLEASVVKISLEVNSSDEGIFNFPVPSGVTTWNGMNGVVDETSQYVITTTIDTSDADVPKICRAGNIVDSFYGLVKNNINTDLVRVSDTLDYDNTYYSFVNTHGVGGGGSN